MKHPSIIASRSEAQGEYLCFAAISADRKNLYTVKIHMYEFVYYFGSVDKTKTVRTILPLQEGICRAAQQILVRMFEDNAKDYDLYDANISSIEDVDFNGIEK